MRKSKGFNPLSLPFVNIFIALSIACLDSTKTELDINWTFENSNEWFVNIFEL